MRSERLVLVLVVVLVTTGLIQRHRQQPEHNTVPIEVVGDVSHPGWYAIAPDATVADAVAMAGGQTEQTTPVGDGARLRVLEDGRVRQERGAPLLAGNRVDLNRDDRQALMHLPQVGASLAHRIHEVTALQTPHDALDVSGVGPRVFDEMHPLVWTPSPPPRAQELPVNFNTADASRLVELPGIGPVLAQRLVASREQLGPFVRARDLQRVHGIGVTRATQLAAVGVFE